MDTPLLSKYAPIDSFIDLLETMATDSLKGFFHSSPEYAMKKLLAKGSPDIYQLSHVFRKNEMSSRHKVEFTMLEWYRKNFTLDQLMQETRELIALFIGDVSCSIIDYKELFDQYYECDPSRASFDHLKGLCGKRGLSAPGSKDECIDFLFSLMEEDFSKDSLCFVVNFPKELAFLAKTQIKGRDEVALRFEAYYKGYELANGFDELQDASVMRKRIEASLAKRKELGKPSLLIDEEFLESLDHLPDCCGVAVGFDRLMMLKENTQSIHDVTYGGI